MSLLRLASASLCAFSVLVSVPSPAAAGTLQDYEMSARRMSSAPGCLPAPLKAALARVRATCGKAEVISTHRPGARIAGSGRVSYHASCRAVDFNAPHGCARQALANWSGGLGFYYGSMQHIHLDTGPRVRFAHGGGGTRVARARSMRTRVARGLGRYRVVRAEAGSSVSSARRLRSTGAAARHRSAKVRYAKHRSGLHHHAKRAGVKVRYAKHSRGKRYAHRR